ncbi:MAG: hypothetical protein AB7P40_07400 [Chloroflexota bacterium]
MDRQHQRAWPSVRATSVRRVTHALLLAVIGLVVGLTSLTAAAEESNLVDGGAASIQSPADVQLRVGEAVTLDNGALTVTLLAVTEDSRCPKDVMCVWSGRAVVLLHVVLDGADRGDVKATLMPGRQGPSDLDAVVDRYRLALTDVQPYPDRSHPEPTLETVATIHVSSAP